MTATPSIIKSGHTLTVHFPGKVYPINDSVSNWERILKAIKEKQWDTLREELDIALMVNKRSMGRAEFIDGEVYLDGKPVRNAISKRILEMVSEEWDFAPMLKFLENVYANPAPWAIEELFLFLETNNLPITEDGCFLAYKVVDANYMDCYSGTVSNKVGETVQMERKEVDPVRDRTCSNGLHFCSYAYIETFSSWYNGKKPRLMLVKIDPRDVVSIPSDYQNTKGRTCKYLVIDEIDLQTREAHNASAPPVVNLQEVNVEGVEEKVITLDMIVDMIVQEIRNMNLDFRDVNTDFEYSGDDLDLEEVLVSLDTKFESNLAGDFPDSLTLSTVLEIGQWVMDQLFSTPKADQPIAEDDLYLHFNILRNPAGNVLKHLREEQGVSGQEMANKLGLSRSAVWSYESSLRPKEATIIRVLQALKDLKG